MLLMKAGIVSAIMAEPKPMLVIVALIGAGLKTSIVPTRGSEHPRYASAQVYPSTLYGGYEPSDAIATTQLARQSIQRESVLIAATQSFTVACEQSVAGLFAQINAPPSSSSSGPK
jgi:hypothetical protein